MCSAHHTHKNTLMYSQANSSKHSFTCVLTGALVKPHKHTHPHAYKPYLHTHTPLDQDTYCILAKDNIIPTHKIQSSAPHLPASSVGMPVNAPTCHAISINTISSQSHFLNTNTCLFICFHSSYIPAAGDWLRGSAGGLGGTDGMWVLQSWGACQGRTEGSQALKDEKEFVYGKS